MAFALHKLFTRAAIRALAGGRAPAYLRPQLRVLRRAVFCKPRSAGPGVR